MNDDTVGLVMFGAIVALVLTIIAVVISFWFGVGYVIWHFISKFW